MTCPKFSCDFKLPFALAALLAVASAATAQTQDAARRNAAISNSTPTVTTFRFDDGGNDSAGHLTTDAVGDIYISAGIKDTGKISGFAILKYDNNGKLLSTFRRKPLPGEFGGSAQSVKLDQQNNLYAIGSTSSGGLVTSFTSAGVQRWANPFDVQPIALAIDATGNIYVAGNGSAGGSDGAGPVLEWLIVKYSSAGKVLWEQRHTGIAGEDSRVRDIQLDGSGNAIVLGTTSNNPTNLTNNLTVAKFDPHGDLLWAKDFSVAHVSQVAGGIAVDGGGNVYATSVTNPAEGIATPSTVKYDANGNLKFVLQGNGAGGSSVAIDAAGDVLLTGATISFGTPKFIAATKIHPSGQTVWTTQIPETGKIVVDSSGNAFVAGTQFVVTKLNASGKILFSSSVVPGGVSTDGLVDALGDLLTDGFGEDAQFSNEILMVKIK